MIHTVNCVVVADGHRLQAHRLQMLDDDLHIGQKIPVEVIRNGRVVTLNVVPAAVPAGVLPISAGRRELNSVPQEPINSFDDLGVGISPLTPTTTPTWNKQSMAHGVLIDTVKPGSPAAEAGLRPGMIIEKVGGTTIATPADVTGAQTIWTAPAGVLLLVRSAHGSRFVIVGGNS